MINIICVGKIKEQYLVELINDYQKRINKYHKLNIVELKDNDDITKETKDIVKYINSKDYNIALSINGNKYDSLGFASHIESLFIKNGTINFIIGGSNGLETEVLNLCNEEISFSALTFPHGLFRGILLEQIYRSFKINNNEKYHK